MGVSTELSPSLFFFFKYYFCGVLLLKPYGVNTLPKLLAQTAPWAPRAPVPDVLFVGTQQILIAAADVLSVQAKIPQFANLSFY